MAGEPGNRPSGVQAAVATGVMVAALLSMWQFRSAVLPRQIAPYAPAVTETVSQSGGVAEVQPGGPPTASGSRSPDVRQGGGRGDGGTTEDPAVGAPDSAESPQRMGIGSGWGTRGEVPAPPELDPTDPGPPEPGPTDPGPAEPGPTDPGPAEPGPTDPGPAEPGPAAPEPAEPGPAGPEPAEPEPGPTASDPADTGSTAPGPPAPNPTTPGSERPRTAQEGVGQDGTVSPGTPAGTPRAASSSTG